MKQMRSGLGKNWVRSETKTGCASAGEKIVSPQSGANRGMPGARTPRKKRQCSGLGEIGREAPEKQTTAAQAGKKRGAKRREPGEKIVNYAGAKKSTAPT